MLLVSRGNKELPLDSGRARGLRRGGRREKERKDVAGQFQGICGKYT